MHGGRDLTEGLKRDRPLDRYRYRANRIGTSTREYVVVRRVTESEGAGPEISH
jgi:hypothetical protein